MTFDLQKTIEILERTPGVLDALLNGISDSWIFANEGENTFSPFDVVGHLIHGERTDWIPRMEIILAGDPENAFKPYDRFAQFTESKGKSLNQLLDEFKSLRAHNLDILRKKDFSAIDFQKKATHPALGKVTLQELLSTWTVHDLSHIGQIVRVMSKQYKDDVGPWQAYLPILTR